MASISGISVSRFKSLFKIETGESPRAFLRSLRLELAREILSDTSCFLEIKQVAYKVGISNGSQFSREFRKFTGFSPSDFRLKRAEFEQSEPPNAQE